MINLLAIVEDNAPWEKKAVDNIFTQADTGCFLH